ncbi:MAG: hypothetical protein HFJ21_02120 [Clostridia bacterium]|jgi:hypothetical protein|nr:hypothetical protein [Clostridia bacterium]MCI9459245.1 hypothetical protein [Clostridia bacterium]
MEKPELNKLFKDGNIQINLRRATFDRLQIKPSVNYRGKTQDEVFFQKQDGNNVEFEVVRRMDFDPEGVFEITVVYTIRRQIADEFVGGDLDFRELLKTFELKDFNFLCGNVFSAMSLIISQFTQASNGIPMVSPPVYCGVAAKSADAK